MSTETWQPRRQMLFAGALLLWVAVSLPFLVQLFGYALIQDHASHILLIPLVSAYLLFVDRNRWLTTGRYEWSSALPLLFLGGGLAVAAPALRSVLDLNDFLSLSTLSFVLGILGIFVGFFGGSTFRREQFGLLFLLFMVPLPTVVLNTVIYFLQVGSAWVANLWFSLSGVPFLREDLVFYFSGMGVRVAEECSGIRSSMSLLITTLLAGHFLLKSNWSLSVLVLTVIPMTLFKNGLRIAALTLLALYVDRGFLSGSLHRNGGVFFFILSLLLMWPILLLLQRLEQWRKESKRRETTGYSTPPQADGLLATSPEPENS